MTLSANQQIHESIHCVTMGLNDPETSPLDRFLSASDLGTRSLARNDHAAAFLMSKQAQRWHVRHQSGACVAACGWPKPPPIGWLKSVAANCWRESVEWGGDGRRRSRKWF
eukprot:GABV01009292.1.p1 GENE.GABV01009292.1~~GABV01009292.1.p1  ORF type:complete len:111 (+),score=16.49 GABV01009292.1:410-742(+)